MLMRALVLSIVFVFVVLSGCNPGDDAPVPAPITPAFPSAMPTDPQAMFDQWKDIISNPEKVDSSMMHAQLAMELRNREPVFIEKMVDLLVDPATKPESRYLILSSLEVAQTPALYPRLLDLTKTEVEPSLRAGVVLMLKNADDPAVSARLRELTNDPERRVRLAALMALSEKGDAATRATLQEYYFTEGLPPEHRARIVLSLAIAPEATDTRVFTAALNDATLDDLPRLNSTGALGRIGDPAGIAPLKQCADGDNSPELKQAAANAAKYIEEHSVAKGNQ